MASIIITLLQATPILMAMASMARQALFLSSFILLIASCQSKHPLITTVPGVPPGYVPASDPLMKQQEGYLVYKDKRFSGREYELYPTGDTALLIPYYEGKEEGLAVKWYADGKKMEARFYS